MISAALKEVGNKFDKGELFLVHLISAGETAKKAISDHLTPLLKKSGLKSKAIGRIVLGTVSGDIHDIGKDIVSSMLFSNGFEIIDLGKDVPTEDFIKAIRTYQQRKRRFGK